MRALSRFALVGIIGGGVAACSSDASRLGDPFTNPFAASEPSATGSLPDQAEMPRTAPLRTGQVQSESLPAPTARMSPRPAANPAPAMTSRVASTEPSIGAASGMNPDAGKSIAAHPAPAPAPMTPSPKAVEKRATEAARKEAEAKKIVEARKLVEANKQGEARKLAEAKKLVEEKKLAEAKAQKEAEAAKRRVRPGQSAKAEDKSPKAAEKAAEVKKAETKKVEPKAEPKLEAKVDPAKAKAEAARKAAEAEAKTAKAEAAKQAANKAAEAKAQKDAEAAKAAAPVKVAATPAPEKVEPASTGSVATEHSFRWPAKGRVIAGYGSSGNEGINIAVPEGTPVKAAEDGTVAYAGSDVKGYGKLVLVRHNNGYVSAYAHNAELDVRPGEKVKRGQTIAKSGASGNVTSPQLHFEIRKGATPVDPMPHLASN
ncbi:M23 family metallopeptidase [Methylobacterium iners]|uniref:M23ase beta-sheet core domain-containing protein n=1 Tax=Methylobacterium iners TaxID=418707 RepID=A0ABQ4RYW3_9HYPH|nr:M23 family metallopeptidase [Methylobacterium iners]GJD94710.1 hypothetical protein OCOJLMKI_1913 [Methylobacterium iners]